MWSDIPKSLQVYGLGDLKFGHLTFIVLTGILVRDLVPDPDIVCKFLNGNQWHAIIWFYEWILKSVQGSGTGRSKCTYKISDDLCTQIQR